MRFFPIFLLFVSALPAQEKQQPKTPPPAADAEAPASQARTQLNLLGVTDSKSGESRRNENVQFNLVDNNAQKELNQRIGVTATFVSEFTPDKNYFGAEFGSASSWSVLQTPSLKDSWHGTLGWTHLNSITSARAFFQVGEVQPARDNVFSATTSGRIWRGGSLTLDGTLQANRGMVNGNILAPLAHERTPLTNDPGIRPIVQSILDSYPNIAPNRTDIDPRMVNVNSPQRIDNRNALARFDQQLGKRHFFTASHNWIGQTVQAFQFVKGQNPNTTTRAHRAALGWTTNLSPRTVATASFRFDRTGTVISPQDGSVPYAVYPSFALTQINANNGVPINRAQNAFRTAVQLRHSAGRHNWSFGGQFNRHHFNGLDSDAHMTALSFNNTPDADAITNLRRGTPINLFKAVGFLHRGFRYWDHWLYATDNWRVSSNFTLNYGVGYRPITRPYEVNNFNQLPYYSDMNNFGPFFGFAYRLKPGFGVLRGGYGLHHGEIFPVTFQQIRFNLPWNNKFVIQNANLANPLAGIGDPNNTSRAVQYDYAPDLVSPYANLYNFTWEFEPLRPLRWQIGYVGSRGAKLLYHYYANRAHPREGIPTINATVDLRRADSTRGEIRRVLNMSRSFYDAFKTTATVNRWRGLQFEASYWFSKAMDLGADYTSTSHDTDSFRGRSQNEFEVFGDMKGRSRFDQPHAFLVRGDFTLPRARRPWIGLWNLSGVGLAKSGTPFQVSSGSDAPGFGNVDGINNDRPDIIDPSILGRSIRHPDLSRQLLPRSAFQFITPGTPRGNLGRFTFRRGPIRNLNGALQGQWRLRQERLLSLRVEANNLTNTPQFAEPGSALTDPNFGVIINTLNDGRSFRFSLQFRY
jgi:hypothetical protein